MNSFTDLGLNGPILAALADERHVTPTPIQAQAIPKVLEGRDLLGIAQTGTGKTAAFALPILDHLSRKPKALAPRSCRVLVLSPTRELTNQTVERFEAYGAKLKLRIGTAIGGVPLGRQIRSAAAGLDIMVATPGRLLDLVEQGALRLSDVEILVLDEADQMLDMGFIHAIRAVVAKLPAKRQNLFFSATMPNAIAGLAGQLLKDPAKVAVTPVAKTADKVEQQVMFVDAGAKGAALASLLKSDEVERALVFTRTKRGADKVARQLASRGIEAQAIHGNKSQPQRERALGAFRQGDIRILVATDIAARGIDVENISHVVNYELPNIPESYVHRIGRTARAGAGGIAVSLCDREERDYLRSIEKLIRQQIPVMGVPAIEVPVLQAAAEAAGEGRHWHPQDSDRRRPRQGQRQKQRPNPGREERHAASAARQPGAQRQAPAPARLSAPARQAHFDGELRSVGFLQPARAAEAAAEGAGRPKRRRFRGRR